MVKIFRRKVVMVTGFYTILIILFFVAWPLPKQLVTLDKWYTFQLIYTYA